MYVAVDVETHDWVKGGNVSRANFIGRIVEIAWVAYDARGNVMDEKCHVVKPEGYTISEKARLVHGISTEIALKEGSAVDSVLADFCRVLEKIPKEGFVIAHNMHHEDACFANNLNAEA
jgi:DNA polymerase III epsilon subunit-like protein